MYFWWPSDLTLDEKAYEGVLIVCLLLTLCHAWKNGLYVWVLAHVLLRTYRETQREFRLFTSGYAACFPRSFVMYSSCVPMLGQELQYAFWPYLDILIAYRMGMPRYLRPVAVPLMSYMSYMAWALAAWAAGFCYHDLSKMVKEAGYSKALTRQFGTGPVFFWLQSAPFYAFWCSCAFEGALVFTRKWRSSSEAAGNYPKLHPVAQLLMVVVADFLDQQGLQWRFFSTKPMFCLYITLAVLLVATCLGVWRWKHQPTDVTEVFTKIEGTMEVKQGMDYLPMFILSLWHSYILLAFFAGCRKEGFAGFGRLPQRFPPHTGKHKVQDVEKLLTNFNIGIAMAVFTINFVLQRFVYFNALEGEGVLVIKDTNKPDKGPKGAEPQAQAKAKAEAKPVPQPRQRKPAQDATYF